MTKHKLKFSNQDNPAFITELRGQVKEYFEENNISKYGNTSIVLKSALMILLYIGPLLLMLTGVVNTFPLIILSWLLMGMGMSGIGMVLMHDANHRTFSKNTTVNKWLAKSIYFIGGYPPTWRYQHNTLHHGFTNIEGHDDDINTIGLLRFSPHKPLYKAHKYQQWYAWLFYCLMTISWSTTKDFKQLVKYKKVDASIKNKSKTMLMADLIATKLLYYVLFLVLPIIFISISWYWTVLFFLMMHFVSGLILSAIFQTAHVMPSTSFPLPDDKGNLDNNWAIHQLMTTTNYSPKSRVFSWFIGGLNYQVEHHLFPNVSHVHYKKISPLVRQATEKHGLPYHVEPSFAAAVYSHFKMLKMLGKQPELNEPAPVQQIVATSEI